MINEEEYIKRLLRKQFDDALTPAEKAQLQAAPLLYTDEEWDALVIAVMTDHSFVCTQEEINGQLPVARAIIRRSGMKGPALLGLLILFAWGGLAYYFWSANRQSGLSACETDRLHPWITSTADSSQMDTGGYSVKLNNMGIVCIAEPINASDKPFVIQTSSQQVSQLELPDGSRIWLNANSTMVMEVGRKDTNQQIYLDGEAYFEISGNRTHPFVVKMDKGSWTSVTSSVNLSSKFNRVLVAVVNGEGQLQIDDHNTDRLMLRRKDIAFYQDTLALFRNQNLDQVRNWMKKKRTYKATALKTVVMDLAGWYGIQLDNLSCLPAHPITFQYCYLDDRSKLLTLLDQQRVSYHYENRELGFLPE